MNVPFIIVSDYNTASEYVSILLSRHILLQSELLKGKGIFEKVSEIKKSSTTQNSIDAWQLNWEQKKDIFGCGGYLIPSALFTFFYNIFPKAYYLILNSNDDKLKINNIQQTVLEAKNNATNHIYFLDYNYLHSHPECIVEKISQIVNLPILYREEISPLPYKKQISTIADIIKTHIPTDINLKRIIPFDYFCSLHAIIIVEEESIISQLDDQLLQLYFQSEHKTTIYFIAINDEISSTLKKQFSYYNDFFIIHYFISSNPVNQINLLFNNIPTNTYVLISNASVRFPLWNVMNQISEHINGIYFACIHNNIQAIASCKLSELLTLYIPQGLVFFQYNKNAEYSVLDDNFDVENALWDWLLKQGFQNSLYAVSSFPLLKNKKIKTSYSSLLYQKHKDLIAKELESLTYQLSSVVWDNVEEKKRLTHDIEKLQKIVTHTREEIEAIQTLNMHLHRRIQHLENSFYIRFKKNIKRLKQIFWKEKTGGTSFIKRIFSFIRFTFSKAGLGLVRKMLASILKKLYTWTEPRNVNIVYTDEKKFDDIFTYNDWIKKKLDIKKQKEFYEKTLSTAQKNICVSIVMPVYNTPIRYLKEAIDSVIHQIYPHWQLCIADDHSTQNRVRSLLQTYSRDPRIEVTYRKENGHIVASSNTALSLAKGEYVLLLDHDDLLAPNCIAEFIIALQKNPEGEIFYTDEDKIDDLSFHQNPHFKPDWSPDSFMSRNYLGHAVFIKKTLLDEIGGFRLGYEGSQDYDLLLRATEKTQHIIHIPKVLYHWRIHSASAAAGEDVKPYAYIAAKQSLRDALNRRGIAGDVKYLPGLRGYQIEYELTSHPLISIIIPSKNQSLLLKNTIDSILARTDYTQYEIIIINNNSTEKEFFELIETYSKKYPHIFSVLHLSIPFNFSKLMNEGVRYAKGEYILLLNNDVEIIHSDWLRIMISYGQQKHIGAVGAKLLYPDDTIQHAGVIVGLGGVAGHSFVGSYKDDAGYFNYIQTVNNYTAVTAACLLIEKNKYLQVGGMNELFEVEYNDVDFCIKLKEAGMQNIYLPQVSLYHYESASRGHPHQSKVSYERHLKEMELFKSYWQKYIDHDPHYNPNLNLGVHDFSMNFSA